MCKGARVSKRARMHLSNRVRVCSWKCLCVFKRVFKPVCSLIARVCVCVNTVCVYCVCVYTVCT